MSPAPTLFAATAASLLLALPCAAQADQAYRIDFSGFSRSCIRVVFCTDNPLAPFSGTFSLTDAEAGAGGSVDIADRIVLGRLGLYDAIPGASQSATALALLDPGPLPGVVLNYSGSYSAPVLFGGTTSGTARFHAEGGQWTQDESTVTTGIVFTSSSSHLFGSYSVVAVPEPATWALWLATAVGAALLRRRYSAGHASAGDTGRAARPAAAA